MNANSIAFKSWNTCMDNNICKIVAIVGFALAGVLCLWLVIGVLRCMCTEIGFIGSCCCCCCTSKRTHDYMYSNQQFQQPLQQSFQQPPTFTPAPHMPYQHRDMDSERSLPEYGYVGNETDYKPSTYADKYYNPHERAIEMDPYQGHHSPALYDSTRF
jgi:hypothetical protein